MEAVLKHPDKTLATSRWEYDCELFLFLPFKTRKQIFTVEVEVILVVANLTFRELKKTTTATAAATSLNKMINEQNNGCARAL